MLLMLKCLVIVIGGKRWGRHDDNLVVIGGKRWGRHDHRGTVIVVNGLNLIPSSIVSFDKAIEFVLCAKTFPQTVRLI